MDDEKFLSIISEALKTSNTLKSKLKESILLPVSHDNCEQQKAMIIELSNTTNLITSLLQERNENNEILSEKYKDLVFSAL